MSNLFTLYLKRDQVFRFKPVWRYSSGFAIGEANRMRAHYLQHVPFEGLGSIEGWLDSHGYAISVTRLFAGDPLPALADIDLLIIMGGPMSVNDEAEYPWLVAEKAYVRSAIDAGLPVLGVCLGAQLIATALGSRVYPNALREIGWYPVRAVEHDAPAAFGFPAEALVLHWHGETFDLPDGAIHLARSAGCANQAFQVGEAVLGLQFHLEATPELMRGFIDAGTDDLSPDVYVQPASEILAVSRAQLDAVGQLMARVLAYLHEQANRRAAT